MHSNQGQKISAVLPQDKFQVSKPLKHTRSHVEKVHEQHGLRPQLPCDLNGHSLFCSRADNRESSEGSV